MADPTKAATVADTPDDDPRKQSESESVESNGTSAFVENVISGQVSGRIIDPGSGKEIKARFNDLGKDDQQRFAALEERATDGDLEADEEFIDSVISDQWVWAKDPESGHAYGEGEDDPLPDPDELGIAFKRAVFLGFLGAVGVDNESMQDAERFFDERLGQQGNG